MREIKYCAYIDVLGYGSLVGDSNLSDDQKQHLLNSIYTNLATQFSMAIMDVNRHSNSKVYMRSFSDCFYLDCSEIEPLLFAVEDVFSNCFGFYSNFTEDEERTPFLRCGIVKDWLIKFRDFGAIAMGTKELNPVGMAVARAYNVSEKSGLSGMQVILSPEVIADLDVLQVSLPNYPCFIKQFVRYGNVPIKYYFKHITSNERGAACDLYTLLWCYSRLNSHAYECVDLLRKVKRNFGGEAIRHFHKTVDLFIDTHLLADDKVRNPELYQRDQKALLDLKQ